MCETLRDSHLAHFLKMVSNWTYPLRLNHLYEQKSKPKLSMEQFYEQFRSICYGNEKIQALSSCVLYEYPYINLFGITINNKEQFILPSLILALCWKHLELNEQETNEGHMHTYYQIVKSTYHILAYFWLILPLTKYSS